MKIAIYARKSKMTDKGESIENQIQTCKDYITNYSSASDVKFIIFKDEGFSGGNMERPEFKKLLKAAKKNEFNTLICYRLDRVSRSVADFSNTYDLLQAHGINFISVKEQFDTTTPIGRAMLNISMVFAQLERETIAERIRDNMLSLARTGRWLGGMTPTGFISEPIEYYDANMHLKKMYKLVPVENELTTITIIYDKFMELKSLRGVEAYLLSNNILTKNNCNYLPDTIKDILTNPVYAAADEALYDYLEELGCDICNNRDEFTGEYGIMIYNKSEKIGKKIQLKNPTLWVAAIGKHTPLLPGAKWVLIQKILDSNTSKSFFTGNDAQYGLLAGLIKCKYCGKTMRLKKGKPSAVTGKIAFTYVCHTKELTKRKLCNCPNIIGQDADADVKKYLLSLTDNQSFVRSNIHANTIAIEEDLIDISIQINKLQEELEENKKAIHNVMEQLSQVDVALSHHFIDKLKELDDEQIKLKERIKRLENNKSNNKTSVLNMQLLQNALNALKSLEATDDIQLQRSIIRSVVERIVWDGEALDIQIFGTCDHTTSCNGSECTPSKVSYGSTLKSDSFIHHTALVNTNPNSFGYKLYNLRVNNNISKKDIMNLLNVSKSTISRYEAGQTYPSVEEINILANYMNVDPQKLYDDYIHLIINFKDEVKALRKELNLSRSQFAKLLNIHAANTIREWELGKHLPNTSIIKKILQLKKSPR